MSNDAPRMDLLTENPVYKPFRYPWAHEAWLKQQQLHWLPEEVPLADDVKNWHKDITSSERNLLTQIFRFFTQSDVEVNNCYRAGTEIMTGRGWVDFRELIDTDVVLEVGSDGRSNFVKPSAIIKQPVASPLIRFHSARGVDVTVTQDHDMVVMQNGELSKVPANKYPKVQNVLQPLAAPLRADGDGLSARDMLLIAYQADARQSSFRGERKADCRLTFGLKKQRKISRLLSILKAGEFDFDHVVSEQGINRITCTLPDAINCVGKGFEWVDLTKVGVTWCREFIHEVSLWDGWISDTGAVQYRNLNEGAVDTVQAIAALAGYKTKKVLVDNDCVSTHWLLSISPTKTNTMTRRVNRDTIIPDHDEQVYCVTVPSGMIVVRSAGMVLVSGNCYMKHYSQVFKPTEVLMMLSAFSNSETIHIAAYSYLLDTIGMPELEYSAFLKYKEMKDKFDYMQTFRSDSKHEIAKTLAAFGAFTEGLQLFASFAILLNFPRHNKMKGMGQIVSWSVRDESLHCLSAIRLFKTFIGENPEVWTDAFKQELYEICSTIIHHEDAFIDLAFEQGPIEGLTPGEVKQYIRYIADRRLTQLGLEEMYHVSINPLPWIDDLMNAVEHSNFFESRATEYSRAATRGTWEDAFDTQVFSEAA